MAAQAFFMPSPSGQRFCIYHPPQGSPGRPARGRVLYIHPLAEEMNKARRMAALQARALAGQGFAVLQVDLAGCGDSSGDFGDARWDAWLADVVRACAWLRLHAPGDACAQPLWLWGLRAGCLLCLQAARQLDEACYFVFWQPPASGKTVLQQFLRLKLAAQMLGRASQNAMASLHQRLKNGQSVEVAGYRLSADVALGLEQARLQPPHVSAERAAAQRVEWFELSSLRQPRLSPLAPDERLQWCRPGLQLVRHALAGPAFWQTADLQEAPDLLAATTAALCTADA